MINNNTDDVAVVHGMPIVASIGPNDKLDQGMGPIYFKTSYINNLPFPVVIVERNGLRHTVRSAPNNFKHAFIIRTEIIIRSEAYNDIERVVGCLDDNVNNDLKVIKEAYYLHRSNRMNQGMTIVIDHPVTIESIKERNGNLYYRNKDIVISTLPLLEAPAHPFSEGIIPIKDYEGFNEEHNVIVRIEIVDNKQILGNRFVCITKQVHKLVPKKDNNKKDGIYITTTERDITTLAKKKLVQTRFDVEDCEKTLGIYKTQEEALSSGDNILARKEELSKNEHEFKLRKLELEHELQERTNELLFLRNKTEHETREYEARLERETHERTIEQNEQKAEAIRIKYETELKENKAKLEELERTRELQQQINKITLENKILEAAMEREKAYMKDFYESKSYDRKDNSEFLKWLPTIIAAGGAIFIAFIKISNSNK